MPRPLYRNFRGGFLRAQRERKGWTQEQLAVRIGAFPTMVGKWERGQVTPSAGNVTRLAAVLEVTPQEFTDVDPASMTVVELRVRAGLTRAQAARAAGVSVRRLTQYEHLSCRPDDTAARALGDVYGVPAGTILTAWDRDRATAYPGLPLEDRAG